LWRVLRWRWPRARRWHSRWWTARATWITAPPAPSRRCRPSSATPTPPLNLGGSELDAAYARVENGRLYVLFTGNHEPNFNKLDVFIDSVAGGENVLSSTPQYDFSPSPGVYISQNMGGLTFDTGPGEYSQGFAH
jgi:hypothetical protein